MSRNINLPLSVLLYYTFESYQKRHPNPLGDKPQYQGSILLKALWLAQENGLGPEFARQVYSIVPDRSTLDEVIEEGKYDLDKLAGTISSLNQTLNGSNIPFLFIKLYRAVPYVPRDVDIFISDRYLDKAICELKKAGFRFQTFDRVETECRKEGLYKVDVYSQMSYLSTTYFDEEFMWQEPLTVSMAGNQCLIPNRDADFLILLIHAWLGMRNLSLLDYLYTKYLFEEGNKFTEAFGQAEKYGWENSYIQMFTLLNKMSNELDANPSMLRTDFPLLFSYKDIYDCFEGFKHMEYGTGAKMMMVISTLMDQLPYRYQLTKRATSLTLPEGLRRAILIPMYRIRHLSGDQKL